MAGNIGKELILAILHKIAKKNLSILIDTAIGCGIHNYSYRACTLVGIKFKKTMLQEG